MREHIVIAVTRTDSARDSVGLDPRIAVEAVKRSLITCQGQVVPNLQPAQNWRSDPHEFKEGVLTFRFKSNTPYGEFSLCEDGSCTMTRELTFEEVEASISVYMLAFETLLTLAAIRNIHRRLGQQGAYAISVYFRGADKFLIAPDSPGAEKNLPEGIGRIWILDPHLGPTGFLDQTLDLSDPELTADAVTRIFEKILGAVHCIHKNPLTNVIEIAHLPEDTVGFVSLGIEVLRYRSEGASWCTPQATGPSAPLT